MGISASASAITVYKKDGTTLGIIGRLEGQIASGTNGFAGDDGSETRTNLGARLGLTFAHDLDFIPETKLVGRMEWQIRSQKNDKNTGSNDLKSRYAYIGLSNKTWGDVLLGRTKNPLYQVMKMTDKYKNFTPNMYNYGFTSIDDSYQFNRQDGTVQWNGDFGGHQIQVAWISGNGATLGGYEPDDKKKNPKDTLDYGVMASYRTSFDLGDVTITPSIAASRYKRQDNIANSSKRNEIDEVLGGVQLDYQNWEVAVTALRDTIAIDNKDDQHYNGMDSLVSYDFGKVKALTGYSFLNQSKEKYDEKKDWRAEVQITLAKKTWLSFTYDKNFASANKKTNDDALIAGIRYDF